ncbi:transposase, partial [Escherichia coli]|uniref:transposase n=1 Tax=Escherichia coli TaxID=562 RepID=UPI0012FF7C71
LVNRSDFIMCFFKQHTAFELRIADRGFGSRPECIRSLAFGEADYIVRVHWRGLRWLTAEGMRFDMMGFLRGLDCGKNGETTVMIGNSGNKKAGAPFPARLIAVSLPPEKALISKTRLLSENRRKGRVVQAETLEAAGHVLLLTSLPEDEYSAEQVADCYRLRWQIELAFKRLKSLLHLDALRAKEPELAKAWIFANLLAAFLIDDIIQPSLDFSPRSAGSA